MDKVDLPILPSKMRLGVALAELRKKRRSALVTKTKTGKHVVIDRDQLIRGGNSGLTPLVEIASSHSSVRLPLHRRKMGPATERALDAAGSLFGIGSIEGGKAVVFTRYETVAAPARLAIGYCQCTGPEREICSPDDYPDGKCAQGHRLVCRGA